MGVCILIHCPVNVQCSGGARNSLIPGLTSLMPILTSLTGGD